MSRTTTCAALALLLTLTACSSDETTPPEDEVSLDADACEHFEEGPFAAVTAGAAAADAPAVDDDHTAYTITLVDDGAGMFTGTVSLAVAEATEVLFFTDEAISLRVQDSAAADVALEESCNSGTCSADCATARGRHVVDFETVGTYFLTFGPASASEVTLVHLEGGEHEHE